MIDTGACILAFLMDCILEAVENPILRADAEAPYVDLDFLGNSEWRATSL